MLRADLTGEGPPRDHREGAVWISPAAASSLVDLADHASSHADLASRRLFQTTGRKLL